MKQVTYPEELLLGSVQFSLQKKIRTITNEKTHGLQGIIFVRKIHPTHTDRIIYHMLGSCMVYLLCYILLQKKKP